LSCALVYKNSLLYPLKIRAEDVKNSISLPDIKIGFILIFKFRVHNFFFFKEIFQFLNFILLNFNHFLLTVAGWEEKKKTGKGRKFGRLQFIKEWEFLDEN
jgi:hypothetical protein